MRLAKHVARMGEKRNVCKVLVETPEGKWPLWRLAGWWKDDNKIDLKETGWDGAEWIHLVQDRDQWWDSANTPMNIQVLLNDNLLPCWAPSQEELWCPRMGEVCSGQEFLRKIAQTNIANVKNTKFWDVTTCCLVDVYRCFGGTFCIHPQYQRISQESKLSTFTGLLVIPSQIIISFIITSVWKSSPI
jgi:hypothetical protein